MNKLIFFDLNGTIIERDSRTDLPYEYALNKLLNTENSMENVNTSARSDKDVFMEVLNKFNEKFTEEKWHDFVVLYEEQLNIFKTTDVWRENVDVIDLAGVLASDCHAPRRISLVSFNFNVLPHIPYFSWRMGGA